MYAFCMCAGSQQVLAYSAITDNERWILGIFLSFNIFIVGFILKSLEFSGYTYLLVTLGNRADFLAIGYVILLCD